MVQLGWGQGYGYNNKCYHWYVIHWKLFQLFSVFLKGCFLVKCSKKYETISPGTFSRYLRESSLTVLECTKCKINSHGFVMTNMYFVRFCQTNINDRYLGNLEWIHQMNGWMNGWMNELTYGYINEW